MVVIIPSQPPIYYVFGCDKCYVVTTLPHTQLLVSLYTADVAIPQVVLAEVQSAENKWRNEQRNYKEVDFLISGHRDINQLRPQRCLHVQWRKKGNWWLSRNINEVCGSFGREFKMAREEKRARKSFFFGTIFRTEFFWVKFFLRDHGALLWRMCQIVHPYIVW